jgi:hypothetical protein
MSPSPSSTVPGSGLRLTVVGNPENRRTAMFADAVRAAGHPAPRVLAWRDVVRGRYAFTAGEFVRIDSPGENAEVDRLLRGTDDPTRVEGTALWHRRFTAAVRDLTGAAHRAGAVPSADPDEVAVLFDKRRCHARLAAAGVPVPPALTGPIGGWDELREQLNAARVSRAFVKPAHGSSASGVVALTVAGPGRRALNVEAEPRLQRGHLRKRPMARCDPAPIQHGGGLQLGVDARRPCRGGGHCPAALVGPSCRVQ